MSSQNRNNSSPLKVLLTNFIIAFIIIFIMALMCPSFSPSAFLEAKVRSKVSKVRWDLRVLSEALEAYQAEHQSFPPMSPLCNSPDIVNPDEVRKAGGASLATIRSKFLKPDIPIKDYWGKLDAPYVYYTIGNGWMLLSAGPDRDYDFDPAEWYEPANPDIEKILMTTAPTYNPTNGTVSNGDIWLLRETAKLK